MIKEPQFEQEKTPAELRMRIHDDPNYLPTQAEVKKAFPDDLDGVTWEKFFGTWHKGMPEAYERSIHKPEFDSYKNEIHDIWIKEYIEGLASYLAGRKKELGISADQKMKILEVGAGNGKLSHFLREASGSEDEIEILAVDNGQLGIEQRFEVSDVSIEDALKKFRPDIVISAWMPFMEDWTDSFRETESVQEYLLIGEPGPTGDEETTWGGNTYKLPEEVGGFGIMDLKGLSSLQFCRTDQTTGGHSKTVSFRRK